MKIKPLGSRILVSVAKAAEISPGGIVIPERAREKLLTGEVLATGPGEYSGSQWVDPNVSVGQKVHFSKYAGVEIEPNILILMQSDLLAVEA